MRIMTLYNDVIVICTVHVRVHFFNSQFVRKVCSGIKDSIKPGAYGISLIKVNSDVYICTNPMNFEPYIRI